MHLLQLYCSPAYGIFDRIVISESTNNLVEVGPAPKYVSEDEFVWVHCQM